MKKIGGFLWVLILLLWIMILGFEKSRDIFIVYTEAHPYIGGFVKFAILATMGDLLGIRILKGEWKKPQGLLAKAGVWGAIGVMITLVFSVYVAGTSAAQASGRLPFEGTAIALAFFSSIIMNLTFGPMLYIYHKFGDLYVDMRIEKQRGEINGKIKVSDMVNRIDWQSMVGFAWLKTCLFIWIPAHTIVFLLPEQFRVLASAFLSILLGIIVALSKKDKKESPQEQVES